MGGYVTEASYEMKSTLLYLVALGTLAFAIVVGNVLVILTFVRDKSLRNSTGLLIISLATVDFITGLVVLPTIVMSMVENIDFMKQGFGCAFSGVVTFSCFNCSLLTLSLISVQRYYLISKPHGTFFNKNNTLMLIACVWIYSFGTSLVPLVPAFNGYILYKWSLSCILNVNKQEGIINVTKYYNTAFNTLTFLIAGACIAVSQFHILRVVYSRTKAQANSRNKQLSDSRRFYATKMISCMIAGFLICTIPVMILLFLKFFGAIPPKDYAAFAAFLTWANSLLNPIIYWYFNKKYSKELRASIRRGAQVVQRLSHRALENIPSSISARLSLKPKKSLSASPTSAKEELYRQEECNPSPRTLGVDLSSTKNYTSLSASSGDITPSPGELQNGYHQGCVGDKGTSIEPTGAP